MGFPKDITNQRFGSLIALEWSGKKNQIGSYLWTCQCDCGAICLLPTARLRNGSVKSCGCGQWGRGETASRYKHGHASKDKRTRGSLYALWMRMRQRCHDPNCKAYRDYGGRGIKVCERWNSFPTFLADILSEIGECPPGRSIDRIDTNGNYEPGNVRWATRTEQGENKRNNVWIVAHGERMTFPEFLRRFDVPRHAVRNLVCFKGLTYQEAVDRIIPPCSP